MPTSVDRRRATILHENGATEDSIGIMAKGHREDEGTDEMSHPPKLCLNHPTHMPAHELSRRLLGGGRW
ncbi:hypothetical protein Nepgr_026374 [Nepenthes gracilis]|uniref:Uncharacterized protein n=1 Tax=Nepenthes gracilis TaxID=150966 RepID=A0AAD3T9J5_NEPGR|nr:hypothetical protein Nepgr_026374 [Nepenthes gracilis]